MKSCVVLLAAATSLAACTGASSVPRGGPFVPGARVPTMTVTSPLCAAARGSESLRPRADVTGMDVPSGGGLRVVHTSDLFARFKAICGGCHVEASSGGRHIDAATFAATFDATWLGPIKSDDPKKFMPPPPNGRAFSSRQGNNPVLALVELLETWIAAGRPADLFSVGGDARESGPPSSYGFSPEVGAAMTNLGNCVPAKGAFASSASGVMESLDAFFEGARELPQSLSETDLTTFDAEVLAATGVVAFVPAYPLWSAGSGKLRHIRLPRGQTVKFDKASQTFELPPNTRFYKTFFRKVIDRAGRESHRKMETRVIVARPDRTRPDGTVETSALFGTYVWSDDETTATLGNLPYRDGTTFADQVRTYITDELTYQALADGIVSGASYDQKLAAAVAKKPGLELHYAIPGRIRCVQCHMGSPTKDFVLGFLPLQIARRPNGAGGAYEATGEDELNQLQRLLDYGLISGMDSPADVVSLEESQLPRKPRTPAELGAQAYMLGNCAHCHNPRGLPSVTKAELKGVLDFLPSSGGGGVFEFPLERVSPLRGRGAGGDVPIPYITPSLFDFPVADTDLVRMDDGQPVGQGFEGGRPTWSPKYLPSVTCDADTKDSRAYCGARKEGPSFVPAPWRSLIYRNVDTPFNYFDDFVPFPHMPMNTPGFDCRAPRLMANWMVGLPAARKLPMLPEERLPRPEDRLRGSVVRGAYYDASPQPYVDVKPDDPTYEAALLDAQARLTQYRQGVRYAYCEDNLSVDIYDPTPPAASPKGYRPDPDQYVFQGGYFPPPDPRHPTEYIAPPIGVPYHSHFFPYDPTDPPPPWSPRRPEWKDLLVERKADVSIPAGEDKLRPEVAGFRKVLVDAINEAELTPALRAYAMTERPYAVWTSKPECAARLASQPPASKFEGAERPAWMDVAKIPADAPVYMTSPGATLYRHVCINCHGPRADGKGLQADALAAASEGEARPANFRDGFFGPPEMPGANLRGAFGPTSAAADQWGSRYMAWMALGGTLKRIPRDIIHQVEATKIFGQPRQHLHFLPGAGEASANMLNLAMGMCSVILPDPRGYYFTSYHAFENGRMPEAYPPFEASDTPFIAANGDREMWLDLCTQFSPSVVRVYAPTRTERVELAGLYYADGFPANAPVLDHAHVVQMGVTPGNLYPACVEKPTDPAQAAWLAETDVVKKLAMPECPADFLAKGKVMWRNRFTTGEMFDNALRWELRGAIATGMAVFTHLQSGGQARAAPSFNECQLLP